MNDIIRGLYIIQCYQNDPISREGISTFFVVWQQITGEHWKIEVSILFGVFSLTLLFFANRKLISCHFHSCFGWKFSELLISLWWFLPKFLIYVGFISEEMSYISFEKTKGKKRVSKRQLAIKARYPNYGRVSYIEEK